MDAVDVIFDELTIISSRFSHSKERQNENKGGSAVRTDAALKILLLDTVESINGGEWGTEHMRMKLRRLLWLVDVLEEASLVRGKRQIKDHRKRTVKINRTSNNCHVRCGLLGDVLSIFLSYAFCTRSLRRAQDAKAFIRVWKVMELCYQILVQEKQVTQRELFYKLLCGSSDYFPTQKFLNKTVQDVVAFLHCSRPSLGIMASDRGAVAGRLLLKEPNQEVVDCSLLGSSGYAIPGDLNLLNKLVIQSDARYIIVLEKRLSEDRIFNQLPSILITAKGYPDIATRFLLHRLSTKLPELPILALIDWNPSGLAILCTYKFGSIKMGMEACRYACDVKWLGLRGGDLQLVNQYASIPLKLRDLQIAKSLLSSKMLQDAYRTELTSMVESGQRVEIEALYSHGYDFLARHIVKKIVQVDYI